MSSTQLDATATVPGTFAYIPSAGTVLNVGTQMLNVLFIPTDLVHYNITSKTVTIKVTVQDSNLYPYPGNLYPYPGNLYPYGTPLANGYLWHHHH